MMNDRSLVYHFEIWYSRVRLTAAIMLAGTLFFVAVPARARNKSPHPPSDPAALVLEMVQNELNSQKTDHSLWAYFETRKEHGKTEVLQVVDTKDGEIDHLVSINGKRLTGREQQREDRRIQKLLAHPDQVRKMRNSEASDANEERKLLQMLPNAFIYRYDDAQGNEIRLRFEPNPRFHASGHEAQVFHHTQGEMYIDRRQKRLMEMDGKLISPVKFGDGWLGHLDQGGIFTVRQQDVGGGHWEMTYLDVQMNGRALFFKTIAVRETEAYSGFHRVPDGTTASRAAEFLNVRAGR
jgi:hypothetical protein